jgi:hypothetical protein
LFELNGEHEVYPLHADVTRLFKRGEIWKLCKTALEAAGGCPRHAATGYGGHSGKGLRHVGDPVLRKVVSPTGFSKP